MVALVAVDVAVVVVVESPDVVCEYLRARMSRIVLESAPLESVETGGRGINCEDKDDGVDRDEVEEEEEDDDDDDDDDDANDDKEEEEEEEEGEIAMEACGDVVVAGTRGLGLDPGDG